MNLEKKSKFSVFLPWLNIILPILVSIGTLLFITKPMNVYNQNQAPLVINNPRLETSYNTRKNVTMYDLKDRKVFQKTSLVFNISSGKIIDSKWYRVEKSSWDIYRNLLKNKDSLNKKGKLVEALPELQDSPITPMTSKDSKQSYNGEWWLNNADGSPGSNLSGYYFLLLTAGNGEKYLYGIIITASTSKQMINEKITNIPLKQLDKDNFDIRILNADDAAAYIKDPLKMSTGSGYIFMIFCNMYQNFKENLQSQIGKLN